MKMTYRTMGAAAVSAALMLTAGCVQPNGEPNNTGTGALMGGAFGAMVGAVADRGHPGAGALIGGAAGALAGGLIGHSIDEQQRERLREQYPQTYYKIENNDAVYAGGPPPPPPPPPVMEPAPTASAAPAATPTPASAPTPAASSTPAAAAAQMQPLSVDDIKALTAAGVKPDAINQELQQSQSKFTAQDIAAAQQAVPAIDPAVIAYMQGHSG